MLDYGLCGDIQPLAAIVLRELDVVIAETGWSPGTTR
jgi:hypothetical protein